MCTGEAEKMKEGKEQNVDMKNYHLTVLGLSPHPLFIHLILLELIEFCWLVNVRQRTGIAWQDVDLH